MPTEPKIIAESVQQLTDSILKLSTALLIVPVIFLRFVAEIGPRTNPEALIGVYPVGNLLKTGIFLPLGMSIILGFLAKYYLMHKLNADLVGSGRPLPKSIVVSVWGSGACLLIGLLFLIVLFYQFPLEIPEPFRLNRSHLG